MTHSILAINTIDEWGRGAAKNGTTPEAVPAPEMPEVDAILLDYVKNGYFEQVPF